MKVLFVLVAAGIAIPGSAGAVAGDGIQGRWSISVQGGTDLVASGSYMDSGQGAVLGLPTSLESQGYDAIYGARPLRRLMQHQIDDKLARALLAGDVRDGDTVMVDLGEDELTVARFGADDLDPSA